MPTPPGWGWVLLTDVARLETGHTPSRKHPEYWDGDIHWIGIKDARIHHGRFIQETLQRVTQLGIDNSASRLLPKGTVCLSRTASVGYALIMGREMATSQDFVNWVCSEALRPEFLMYALMAEKDSLRKFGKGTTHTTIYFPEVKALNICLPSQNEQKRIVSKIEELFSDLDAGVAALKRARANLRRYRASVLKSAVEGRLTAAWRKANQTNPAVEPASELLARILRERRQRWEQQQLATYESKGKRPPKNWQSKYKEPVAPNTANLPELPNGWCWATPEQVAAPEPYSLAIGPFGSNLKVGDYREEGVPLVFVRNIRSGIFGVECPKIKYVTEDKAAELDAHSIDGGDVLITKMGDPPGDAIMYPTSEPKAIITADCIKVRPSPLLPSAQFLVWAIRSKVVHNQIMKITRGVAQKKVSLGRFSKIAFPIPPVDEQLRIVELLDETSTATNRTISEIDRSFVKAERTRQSILKSAFEGKLVENREAALA